MRKVLLCRTYVMLIIYCLGAILLFAAFRVFWA